MTSRPMTLCTLPFSKVTLSITSHSQGHILQPNCFFEEGDSVGPGMMRSQVDQLTNVLKRLVEHTAIAMAGGVICSMLIGLSFDGILCALGLEGTVRRLASAWYGPAVWWPGLVLGFFVNRRMLHRTAYFVWLPGLLWLAWGILNMATSWVPVGMSSMKHVRVELFPITHSDYDACAVSECLGPLLWIWPAVNAVTYSIGAALGIFSQPDKPHADEHFTNLTILSLK
jgi:hypothetical protein